MRKNSLNFLFLSAFFDSLTAEEISDHEYISDNLVERLNRFLGKFF